MPAASPSATQSPSEKLPLAAPAERSACTGVPGTKHALRVIVARLAARLRMQVHDRAPSARHREEIAGERLDRARTAVPFASSDITSTAATRHVPRTSTTTALSITSMPALRTRSGSSPCGAGRASTIAATSMPAVDETQRRPIGAVVVGEHDGARAGLHAVAIHVGGHRRGQHHAGAVVVREDERALHRARREHHLLRAHAPDALARPLSIRRRQMIGEALGDRQEVVVVIAEHGAARHQAHVAHRREARGGPCDPRHRIAAADRPFGGGVGGNGGHLALRQEAAAELVLLVGEDHARACAAGGPRRGEARGAAAHDQHVAMGVHPVVAIGIGLGGRRAETQALRM